MSASDPVLERLGRLGWRSDLPAAVAWRQDDSGWVARISAQHRSGYRVADGLAEYPVQAPAPWTRPGFSPVERAVVGDFVRLDDRRDQILEYLPRRNLLRRSAAGETLRDQPMVANIDSVLVVTGLDRDFNVRRLERYLLLVQSSGAGAVLVLSKLDLCADPAAVRQRLAQIEAAGVPVVLLDARDPEAVAQLAPWLAPGHSIVLVGSSGAGKSTLVNTLMGRSERRTGPVRARDDRGRHTTTHRALIPLEGGACLIDTPGMRELKLTGEEDFEAGVFEDIELLAEDCRFRDCRHETEPGCAVLSALEAGELDPRRLASYRKLRDERDHVARLRTPPGRSPRR